MSPKVPKIIHQSYKTPDHPYPGDWQDSWAQMNPKWNYRFHTDDDNRQIVQAHYPHFLKVYDSLPVNIMRADFSRLLYMHLWGGVYADLDYVCLKSFDSLIVQVRELAVPLLPHNRYYQIHNALLVSVPGHPFWLKCAEQAVEYLNHSYHPKVEWLAGPFRLQETLRAERPPALALPQELVTPFDWFSFVPWGSPDKRIQAQARDLRKSPVEKIAAAFPKAYAITFWDHGW